MKTLELKLKKEVIIVENEFENKIDFIDNELGIFYFLCKGSELTEEMASELVDYWQNMANDGFIFENYKDNLPKKLTANDALISAVESKEKFWLDNPIDKRLAFLGNVSEIEKQTALQKQKRRWQAAEEKTFKNPLIFVKNE